MRTYMYGFINLDAIQIEQTNIILKRQIDTVKLPIGFVFFLWLTFLN